jgi:hypothetical protein
MSVGTMSYELRDLGDGRFELIGDAEAYAADMADRQHERPPEQSLDRLDQAARLLALHATELQRTGNPKAAEHFRQREREVRQRHGAALATTAPRASAPPRARSRQPRSPERRSGGGGARAPDDADGDPDPDGDLAPEAVRETAGAAR